MTIGHGKNTVCHFCENRIVSDDHGEGADLAVDALDSFEHQDAGFHVEGAGGFVSEQEFRPFGDRAGDGNPLLFAAGKLGREVVGAIGQINQF